MADDFSRLRPYDRTTSKAGFETWFDAHPTRELVIAAFSSRRDQDIADFIDYAKRRRQEPPRSIVGASPVVAAVFAAFPGAKITNVVVHERRKKFLMLPRNRRVDL